MNTLHIFIGLSVLLLVILAGNVSRIRFSERIANGDGGSKALRKAIRAHMNSLENILPFALALFVLQAQNTNDMLMMGLAYGFLLIRLLFAYSILGSQLLLRQITAGVTYLLLLGAAILILANAVGA